MITRVRLENWKTYRTFDIGLDEGTTFLVAPNGIGKSSFIEAVRWALDAEATAERRFMRRGATTTTVAVDVVAGEAAVSVVRTLVQGRAKAPKMEVHTWLDGVEVPAAVAFQRLADAWGADNRFVSRAAFLTDRFIDERPDLRLHLTKVHSLDRLQDAIALLEPAAKAATAEADAARRDAASTAASVEEARVATEEATVAGEQAMARAAALRDQAVAAREELVAAQQAVAARLAHQAWLVQRDEVVADVELDIGPVPDGVSLSGFVRAAETGARRQLLELTEQRARLSERIDAVEEALGRLRSAGGECPVCRRPLDDDSRAYAAEQHRHDHDVAADQLERLDVDAPADLAARLRQLATRVDELGDEPERPPDTAANLDDVAARSAELTAAFEAALADAGRAQQVAVAARAAVDAQMAAAGPSPAVPLYTRAAALEAAKAALEATITEVLDTQLEPVADEVNRRWEAVFPDRPGLRLDASGQIVRTFDDDGDDLEFRSFSGGERVVSTLLLRLATLTSTTAVPFCWIDEPLEHLDPDARRYVARTLAYLSAVGDLKQIFVTTYEQERALQLTAEAPDDVHLVFLHAAPIAS